MPRKLPPWHLLQNLHSSRVVAPIVEGTYRFKEVACPQRLVWSNVKSADSRDLETVFEVPRLPRKNAADETVRAYQLIRNVLAAFAADTAFCVLCDSRRRDLIESWYSVLSAVHAPSFTWRLKLLMAGGRFRTTPRPAGVPRD